MLPRTLVILFRLALLVAIAASAALVVDYRNAGDPAFCGVASGCYAVRISPYSRPFGIPLPNLGLAAFAVLFAASLWARERAHHRLVAGAAALGGLGATVLIVLQAFVVNAFCAWCVAADVAAIVAAVAAVLLARQAARTEPEALARQVSGGPAVAVAWAAAAGAAVGLPMLWGEYPVVPPLPPEIAAMQAPGKLTIVGFTDFQCPFCRDLHPEIEKAKQAHGDRLHYIRKMAPLKSHRGAFPAAKAYVCASGGTREGGAPTHVETKRDQAAALLYAAEPDRLTPEGVASVLAPLGLDGDAFAACLAAPATTEAVQADLALYEALQGRGLPFTFIGRRVVRGANPDKFHEMIRVELAGDRPALPLPWLFVALAAAGAAAALVHAARTRPASSQ